MKTKHDDKIRELSLDFADSIYIESLRLLNSGGIDYNSYDQDDYLLAKIVISAAIKNKEDVYTPKYDKAKKDYKNLLNF